MAPGFTLVEVLATIAFTSILLPTVMRGITVCLSAADFAKHQAQAASLAHGKLSELAAAGGLQRAVLSGDFGADWPEYRWDAAVTDWDSTFGLLQLEVTVSWRQSGGSERGVTLTSLAYSYATPTGGMP
jgi:type II secretory pathway pseudopilin PulG